jgi:hypothetical protein
MTLQVAFVVAPGFVGFLHDIAPSGQYSAYAGKPSVFGWHHAIVPPPPWCMHLRNEIGWALSRMMPKAAVI